MTMFEPDIFIAQGGNAALRPVSAQQVPPVQTDSSCTSSIHCRYRSRNALGNRLRDFAEVPGFEFFAYLNLRQTKTAVFELPPGMAGPLCEDELPAGRPVVTRAKHGPPIFQVVGRGNQALERGASLSSSSATQTSSVSAPGYRSRCPSGSRIAWCSRWRPATAKLSSTGNRILSPQR